MGLIRFFSNSRIIKESEQQDESDRPKRMERAWRAFYGHTPDTVKVKPGQTDDNVKVNKARVIVDKGVSFLFGDPLSFKLDEKSDPAAQVYLDAGWAGNRMMSFLHKLALEGAVCGHAFVKIKPPPPGKDFPRLQVLDPATVSVVWEPDDIEEVVSYVIQYSGIDPDTGKARNYRQTIKRAGTGWSIVDEQSDPDSSVWHEVGTTMWPHPYAPIVDCQNLPAPNEYWGIPDIGDDILGIQQQLNFSLSNSQRIIRYHAHPKTITSGVGAGEIDVDVDGVIQLPNPDAKMWNLEMQSNLEASRGHSEDLGNSIHEVARVPSIATGTVTNLGPLSGVALEILYQPLIEKTKTKRVFYGDMLVELSRRVLDMAGYGPDNVATITWPKLLPTDPLQERQAYLLEDQMGIVSKQTLCERLGGDWETEKKRMDEEDADAAKKAQALMPPAGTTPQQQSQTLPADPTLNARASNGMKPQGSD